MLETISLGRVVVPAIVESVEDQFRASWGEISEDDVRRVEIAEALVDTGATTLCLPTSLIQQLGLTTFRERTSMSTSGPRKVRIYGPVHLIVQERDCNVDVLEIPDGVPVLIGQVPLELLDFVVDPPGRRLIGNPAHGGEQMLEMY